MKLNAYYSTANKKKNEKYCVKCKIWKKGKFLNVELPNKSIISICNKCLRD